MNSDRDEPATKPTQPGDKREGRLQGTTYLLLRQVVASGVVAVVTNWIATVPLQCAFTSHPTRKSRVSWPERPLCWTGSCRSFQVVRSSVGYLQTNLGSMGQRTTTKDSEDDS